MHSAGNQNSQTETYEKKKGTAGAGGHFYEVKLLTLFYLRLQKTDTFYLASNMGNAGAFDDVVFKYQYTDNNGINKTKTVFLQAKHSDEPGRRIYLDNLLASKGDFSLKKYFESYREIKRTVKPTNDPIFNGETGDCHFIIFTNYILDPLPTDKKGIPKCYPKHISNPDRWLTNKADRIVLPESKCLNGNSDANRDIIDELCGLHCQLAREIYNYTLGTNRDTGLRINNQYFEKYHIFLANRVFSVNKSEPSNSKFRDTFTRGQTLWEEMFEIAKCSEHEFNQKLQNAKIKLFKTFGNYKLTAKGQNIDDLVTGMADIIERNKWSYKIRIEDPSEGITQLANNVLVRVEEPDVAIQRVTFGKLEELTGEAKKFMVKLREKLASKDYDLTKVRFEIKGFPRFSLPQPCQNTTESEVKQFLSQLEFVLEQKQQKDLDEIIREELKNFHKVKKDECNAVYQSVKNQVEKWWESGNNYLTNRDNLVYNAETSISQLFLGKSNESAIKMLGISFNENAVTKFEEVLEQKQVVNLVADEGTTLLSRVKVCQTLREKFHGSYILMQMNQPLYIIDHALQNFQADATVNFLVTENNSNYQKEINRPEEDFQKLYEKLQEIVKKDKRKKVVLITEKNHTLAKYFYKENFHKENDNINLNHLTIESQKKLLDKEVKLHGRSVQMRDLFDIRNESANSAITSKLIMSLTKNDNLIISKAPQRLIDFDAAYTKLYQKIPKENLVRELRTSPEKNSIFFISGIKKPSGGTLNDEFVNFLQIADRDLERNLTQRMCLCDEINNSKGIIIISNAKKADAMKEFRQICSRKHECVIYWVEIAGEHVRLQQVYEPNFYIKRRFEYVEKTVVQLRLICQKNPSALFIFNDVADRERIEELTENLHVEYQRCFENNYSNKTIVFAQSESDAEQLFGKLKGAKTYTHWLKIKGKSKTHFTCHLSHGIAFSAKNENLVFKSDLLVQENSPHTFIFDSCTDKKKVMDMVLTSCKEIRQQFAENCENQSIIFSATKKDIDVKEMRTVHWLQMSGVRNQQLIWKKSHGSFQQMRDYVDHYKRNLYTEREFNKEIKDKVIIIADDPGMGKTTNLTSVSQQMLDDNWVIRVNFLDCDESIEALPAENLNFEDVYNFVANVESAVFKNDLAKQLMLYALDPKEHPCRPILMMFDGYDEISIAEQTKIIPLLQFIKWHTAAKLWVTTRLHMMDALENGLSTFATKFEPLILEEQKEFLNRFWRVRLAPLLKHENVQEKIGKYSSKLLGESAEILGKTICRITGVPLQLRLLAEGLTRDVVSYLNDFDDQHLNFHHLNVLKLYQNFINAKYEIYMREKMRIGRIPPSIRRILVSGFDEHHEKCAMHLLFNENLDFLKSTGNEDKGDMISVGILQSVSKEGKPHFIHRTFAEYFAAKFLVSCLKKKITNPKKHEWATRFLINHIFEESNNVIREFIDLMLSEGSPIHIATFSNRIREVTELAKDVTNPTRVDSSDRTALHLAATFGHLNVVKVLLDNGSDAVCADALGKTPLHYATMNSHGDVVRHLLNYTADIDIGDTVFATPFHTDMEISKNLFRDEYSRSSLVTFVNREDVEGKTAFYYATEINDWRIACTLILYGANICFASEEHKKKLISHVIGVLGNRVYIHIFCLLLLNNPATYFFQSRNDEWYRMLAAFAMLGHTKLIDVIMGNMSSKKCFKRLQCLTNSINNEDNISDADNLKVAEYLHTKCDNYSLIRNLGLNATRHGNLETLKYTLKYTLTYRLKYSLKYITKQKKYHLKEYMLEAIEQSHQNIVIYLFENYSELITNNQLTAALYKAVKCDRLGMVKYLVEKGADVNARYKGETLMQYAASYNSAIIMPYLMAKGVGNINSGKLGHPIEDYVEMCLTYYRYKSMQNHVMNNLRHIAEVCPRLRGLKGSEKVSHVIISQVQTDVNCRNVHGTTLLHIAACFHTASLANYLIENGADVNTKDKKGRTPFHTAVRAYCQGGKNKETVICLLKQGAIYDEKDDNNATVFDYFNLSQATCDPVFELLNLIGMLFTNFIEDTQCTLKLIKHLNNIIGVCGVQNSSGNTPLHLSADSGNVEMVTKFIEHGYPYNSRNKENYTPKDLAQKNGHKNVVEIIQSIEDTFAAIKANMKFPFERIGKEFLLARDEDGKTMLHWAAANGNASVTELFIKNSDIALSSPSIKRRDYLKLYSDTQIEIDYSTLKRDFIHEKDNRGWTPLHYAAKHDKLETLKLLLCHGAEFNPKNKDRNSPLQIATGMSLNFLEQVNEMFDAVLIKSPQIMNECFKSTQAKNYEAFLAAINCKDNCQNQLLGYAVSANDYELVMLLLQNGAFYDEFRDDWENGGKEISILLSFVEQLLSWQRQLIYSYNAVENSPSLLRLISSCRGRRGNTVLHKAADYPVNYCRLRFLVKHGADINAVNKIGQTVLDVSIEKRKLDLVKFLLKNNVNVNKLDVDNKQKLIEEAAAQERQDIVDLFNTMEKV